MNIHQKRSSMVSWLIAIVLLVLPLAVAGCGNDKKGSGGMVTSDDIDIDAGVSGDTSSSDSETSETASVCDAGKGSILYDEKGCSACHGGLAASTKIGMTYKRMKDGIENNFAMQQFASMPDDEIYDIAFALDDTNGCEKPSAPSAGGSGSDTTAGPDTGPTSTSDSGSGTGTATSSDSASGSGATSNSGTNTTTSSDSDSGSSGGVIDQITNGIPNGSGTTSVVPDTGGIATVIPDTTVVPDLGGITSGIPDTAVVPDLGGLTTVIPDTSIVPDLGGITTAIPDTAVVPDVSGLTNGIPVVGGITNGIL